MTNPWYTIHFFDLRGSIDWTQPVSDAGPLDDGARCYSTTNGRLYALRGDLIYRVSPQRRRMTLIGGRAYLTPRASA